jgi:hypothetical protein
MREVREMKHTVTEMCLNSAQLVMRQAKQLFEQA